MTWGTGGLALHRGRLPRLQRIVDPAEATALIEDWAPVEGVTRPPRFWTTGDPVAARCAARMAFGIEAPFMRAPRLR